MRWSYRCAGSDRVILDWRGVPGDWGRCSLNPRDALTVRVPESSEGLLVVEYLRDRVAAGDLIEIPARRGGFEDYDRAFPDDQGPVMSYEYDVLAL